MAFTHFENYTLGRFTVTTVCKTILMKINSLLYSQFSYSRVDYVIPHLEQDNGEPVFIPPKRKSEST